MIQEKNNIKKLLTFSSVNEVFESIKKESNLILDFSRLKIVLNDKEQEKSIQLFKGHKDRIVAIKTLNNGAYLSASSDKTIKLWDPISKKCLRTFEGHSEKIVDMGILSDGNFVSLSSSILKVWDTKLGKCLTTIEVTEGSEKVFVLVDDTILISDRSDFRRYDLLSTLCVGRLNLNRDSYDREPFVASCMLNDGKIMSADKSSNLSIWDPFSMKFLARSEGSIKDSVTSEHYFPQFGGDISLLKTLSDGSMIHSIEGESTSLRWKYQIRKRQESFRKCAFYVHAECLSTDSLAARKFPHIGYGGIRREIIDECSDVLELPDNSIICSHSGLHKQGIGRYSRNFQNEKSSQVIQSKIKNINLLAYSPYDDRILLGSSSSKYLEITAWCRPLSEKEQAHLFNALIYHKNLKTLTIKNIKLNPNHLNPIGKVISKHGNLQGVDIRNTFINQNNSSILVKMASENNVKLLLNTKFSQSKSPTNEPDLLSLPKEKLILFIKKLQLDNKTLQKELNKEKDKNVIYENKLQNMNSLLDKAPSDKDSNLSRNLF